MAFFKKTVQLPKPQDCSLQRIEREQVTRRSDKPRIESRPDHTSKAYQDTLQRHSGKFSNATYADKGGKYITRETYPEVTVHTGRFVCRRTAELGDYYVEGGSPVAVSNELYKTVTQLGWCATCPYRGMNEIEANRYDADKAQSEAELANGTLARAQAMEELDAYLKSRGNGVEASAVSEIPAAMPVLSDPAARPPRQLG